MRTRWTPVVLVGACLLVHVSWAYAESDPDDALGDARAALAEGDYQKSIDLATQVIENDPRRVEALLLRARAFVAVVKPEQAVEDYDQALKLSPEAAELYDARGSARFQAGDVAGSIEDFDRYIQMRPDRKAGHWKRGISYYYTGAYDEGRRQFEAYQGVDDNDVENVVWRYLCMARATDVETARRALLKVRFDRRVPMMTIHAMFAGNATTDDVLTAARAGDPSEDQLQVRLFYAHLYIGLYHEAAGQDELAREHILRSADEYRIGHYMWYVARVHADSLRSAAP